MVNSESILNFTSQLQRIGNRATKTNKYKHTMTVIEMKPAIRKIAKKATALKGSIKKCAEATGVDRTTVSRVIGKGTGEEHIVYKLEEYFSNLNVA